MGHRLQHGGASSRVSVQDLRTTMGRQAKLPLISCEAPAPRELPQPVKQRPYSPGEGWLSSPVLCEA